ncbi:MAG: hypothetical protein HYX53_02025 [Chloroflexi bacterium]|nr:hypothetical protein [Chloroflexota bacterium]
MALVSYASSAWDWRLSAQFRLLSLVTLWAGLMLAPELGPLLLPFALVRTGASVAQLALNRKLAQRIALPRRDRLDYALFGLAFLGAVAASLIREAYPAAAEIPVVLPALLPFSALQLRMCRRSFHTHVDREAVVIPFSRLTEQRAA